MKPVIGILLGNAAGIGPEQVAKLFDKKIPQNLCRPVAIGDVRVLRQGMDIAGVNFEVEVIDAISAAEWDSDTVMVLDQKNLDPSEYKIGEVNAKTGKAAAELMIKALEMCKSKEIDGFFFAPYNKAAMKMGGYKFEDSIHMFTDHLKWDKPHGELNIIKGLWTTRVTSHIPLSKVSENITEKKILETINLAHETLKRAGIKEPRIAVAGINPHNGEEGTCGDEEIRIIAPAVKKAQNAGIKVYGPYSADTIFVKAFEGKYDVVVTMYHDQGQIAMKLNHFSQIVTVLGGLPYPVATPAHGTAFDIAGKGIADIGSSIMALEIVCKMAMNDYSI